ncbi:hypothetical protein [Lysobacter gummosus]
MPVRADSTRSEVVIAGRFPAVRPRADHEDEPVPGPRARLRLPCSVRST